MITRIYTLRCGVLLFAAICSPASLRAAECKSTLAYLEPTIPPVPSSDKLNEIRNQIFKTNIDDVIKKIREQGMSLQDAAKLMFKQADAYDATFPPLEACIKQAASEGQGEKIIGSLKNRQYGNTPVTQDALGACIGSYIANDWAQLANRETAIQVACNAK